MFFSRTETKNKIDDTPLGKAVEDIVANERDNEMILNKISKLVSNKKLSDTELHSALAPLKRLGASFEDHLDDEIDKTNIITRTLTAFCGYLRNCDHNELTREDILTMAEAIPGDLRDDHIGNMMRFVGKEKHLVHRIYDENLFNIKNRAVFLKSISRAL